jgi:thiamine biosynthesis lipoprotein ApbE
MSLRHLLLSSTFAFIVLATPTDTTKPLRIETTISAMGGAFSIVAFGPDANVLRSATEAAGEEVQRLEQLMSNYIAESEWSEINRNGNRGPVRVSRETIELIEACKGYHRVSGGTFDITVGPLMRTRTRLRRKWCCAMRVAPMTSRFLDAAGRRPTDVRPVWFMRQAGRGT